MRKRRQVRISNRRRNLRTAWHRSARFEQLESRQLLTGLPPGAVNDDTGEYMLGNILATVVFFESDGSIDPSTEDWNPLLRDSQGRVVLDSNGRTISTSGPNRIEETKQRIVEGLEWWEDSLANFYALNYQGVEQVHSLNYLFDFQYAHNPIRTPYEPISRTSNEYTLWAADFLDEVGYLQSTSMNENIRAFNDAQRQAYKADWAFTIFVANDHNDFDGMFKLGGSFQRAFAFAGGRHLVSPATRPASTFAHETGHIFYARDEYSGSGAHYTDRRGYYNSQNWNAYDNPTTGWVQQPSIMDTGAELNIAWDTHTSSASSLAMIGWQDADGDGVFDVLDVPLTLTGTGYYNPHQNAYRFTGYSEVQTLVNVNSSGLRSDITINEVNRLVYSLDGGNSWSVVKNYNSPRVQIDLGLPLQPGQEFLLRTESVDPLTGKVVATSNVLAGSVDRAASARNGIQGFVWDDRDADGEWDSNERGVEGWTLQLVDAQGGAVQTAAYVQPDSSAEGTILSSAVPGVTLSAIGWGVFDADVAAVAAPVSGGGERVLGYVGGINGGWATHWTADSYVLRVDFSSPTTMVSIDAIAPANDSYGRLEIYDSGGNLLGRTTTGSMRAGEMKKLSIGMASADIAYALVRSRGDASIVLDNLQVGPGSTVVTGEFGAYAFPHLAPGDYHVMALPPDPWDVAGTGIVDVTVDAQGQFEWPAGTQRPTDFAARRGAHASLWSNWAYAADVNDDWLLSAVDALLVINYLNTQGGREFSVENDPPGGPLVDVNGDGVASPRDALGVIAALNFQAAAPSATPVSYTAWSSAVVLGAGGAGESGEGESAGEGEPGERVGVHTAGLVVSAPQGLGGSTWSQLAMDAPVRADIDAAGQNLFFSRGQRPLHWTTEPLLPVTGTSRFPHQVQPACSGCTEPAALHGHADTSGHGGLVARSVSVADVRGVARQHGEDFEEVLTLLAGEPHRRGLDASPRYGECGEHLLTDILPLLSPKSLA